MLEFGVNQTWIDEEGQAHSRTIGALRIDERDRDAEPEILQPLDGRSLAVILRALRGIARDHRRAREEFGDPEEAV